MPRPHLPLLWLLLVFAMPAGVLAQPAAAHPCAATPQPAERLACYDRAFPPPDTVREAAAARAVEEFGLPHRSRAPVLRNPGQPGHEVEPDRIEARVDRIDTAGGQRWLTLDNGQRWTVPAGTAGPLAPGDPVRISKGALGSHMLRTPGGVSLRARRVH
ncbi:hypothetical protein [Luteimonas granuli]|uniref:Uncharacterized protein n=1 Tax=Luteimonas granuli TaxID=1176533 RepID=A0A518N3K5_9GAMM|nr:hypothetical protein [Luteimonas granuli]QDW66478.1 hypothetical protein FPZ22_05855 [Luteimonas granuli]